jgi:hypothetical protein
MVEHVVNPILVLNITQSKPVVKIGFSNKVFSLKNLVYEFW